MLKTWPVFIFILSFLLIAIIKEDEIRHIQVYRRPMPVLKLTTFEKARAQVSKAELPHLALWESMLTGRKKSLPKEWKTKFSELGLAHLFTPSGFHLSAVIVPFSKLILHKTARSIFIISILSGVIFFCAQPALRRMALVKLSQRQWKRMGGFVIGLTLDFIFGSFTIAPLGFTFSFLFLGIIYSQTGRLEKILLLFFAQALIAYFLTGQISPLLIVLNPLLNFFFGLSMSLLFALAIPLWDWQLFIGLKVVSVLISIVDFASTLVHSFPFIEVTIYCVLFFLLNRRWILLILLLFCNGLNNPSMKLPTLPSNAINGAKCSEELVNGMWFRKCSLRRGSTEKKT